MTKCPSDRARRRRVFFCRLSSVALTLGISGCHTADYGGVEVTRQSTPPLDVRVSARGIELPTGIAMLVKVVPYSRSSQPYTSNDELRLSSSDPDLFQAYQTDHASRVVLTGIRPGEACLRIWIEGDQVDCLPITITPQQFDPDVAPNSFVTPLTEP